MFLYLTHLTTIGGLNYVNDVESILYDMITEKIIMKTEYEGITGKRVFITGGSGGIGSAIARLFASYGARVGISYYKSDEKANALCEEMKGEGRDFECFMGDLRNVDTCKKVVNYFVERFKGVDVLINNAGAIYGYTDFYRMCGNEFDETMALNARAPLFLSQAMLPYFQLNKEGKIINISSVSAKYGGSSTSIHYAMAKAALETLTVGLAREWAEYNILVNTIRCGFIDTEFHRKIARVRIAERIQKIPLKKPGQPGDVAAMALYLASDAGNFITGQTIGVTGGD